MIGFVNELIMFLHTAVMLGTHILFAVLGGIMCEKVGNLNLGIEGMMQASAIERSLSYELSGGLGFTSVIVAWLSRLEPRLILIVGFVFSVLIEGSLFLQASLQIPAAISQIIQGIIIFFVLGSDFFIRYKFTREKNK